MKRNRKSDRPSHVNLRRYRAYLRTPAEDWEAREQIALTEADMNALLDEAMTHLDDMRLIETHRVITQCRIADPIYLNGGKNCGMSIAGIRLVLGRTETRQYIDGDEHVEETWSNVYWPKFLCIDRTRTRSPLPTTLVYEREYRCLHPKPIQDLDALWAKLLPGWQEDAIEVTQKIYQGKLDGSLLYEVFLPPDGVTYRVTMTQGTDRRSNLYPLMQAYRPLRRKLAKNRYLSLGKDMQDFYRPSGKNRADDRPQGDRENPPAFSPHSSDEQSTADLLFLEATHGYRVGGGKRPAGWYKNQLDWGFSDVIEEQWKHNAELRGESFSLDSPPDVDREGDPRWSPEETLPLRERRRLKQISPPDPEQILDSQQHDQRQKKALKKIEPLLIAAVGEPFYRLKLEGETFDCIAKKLGLPSEDAARKRWDRAAEKARTKLCDLFDS